MTRVVLIDDHSAFRQPLAFMLDREADMQVVGQAGSLSEARALNLEFDVVLLDLNLSDGDGLELIREWTAASVAFRALVLTAMDVEQLRAICVDAGAYGILSKSEAIADIIEAMRQVSRGEPLYSPADMYEMLRDASQQREHDRQIELTASRLTPREREVLQVLATGLNDKDIAQCLSISTETVRTHMVNILAKLEVESRLQALVFAVRHKLVSFGA